MPDPEVMSTSTGAQEEVVLVDEAGCPVGAAPKSTVHGRDTLLHLAFSCHVFAPDGKVLLTRRRVTKAAFAGIWSNACCGHPSPGEDICDAVHRRVGEELGVTLESLTPVLPGFRYRAVDAAGTVENEICPVFVGTVASTDLRPSPVEVEEYRWTTWASVVLVARDLPWLLSPWASEQVLQMVATGLPVGRADMFGLRRAGA